MRSKKAAVIVGMILIIALASCTVNFSASGRAEGFDMATAVTAQYRKISPQLAKEMMDSGDPLTIVDVRTPAEYAQGHIQGAILVPNETISTEHRPEELPDTQATVLVYCRSGSRSAQAARKLVSLGYVNVYDFGGVIDWPYELTTQ
jgi:rhodanese-related sulfurtransferase